MTIPDPTIIPQFTAAQYASYSDPPECADIINDTYILEDNIKLVRPSNRGERVIFVHNTATGRIHIRTIAHNRNILTFGTTNGMKFQDTILTLMNARELVKKCLGQYVLLMGERMFTIYQDTGADLPVDIQTRKEPDTHPEGHPIT